MTRFKGYVYIREGEFKRETPEVLKPVWAGAWRLKEAPALRLTDSRPRLEPLS